MKNKDKRCIRKGALKNVIYTILVFFIAHIVYGLLPLNIRGTFSGWVFTGMIFPIIINIITKKAWPKKLYI